MGMFTSLPSRLFWTRIRTQPLLSACALELAADVVQVASDIADLVAADRNESVVHFQPRARRPSRRTMSATRTPVSVFSG